MSVIDRSLDYAARVRNFRMYRQRRAGRLAPFEETGAIFVHIPKTGGVSVSTALFGSDSPAGHSSAVAFRRIYGRKMFDEMFTFTFVRQPLDRLASAYSYIHAGGRGGPADVRASDVISSCSSVDEFICEWLTRPSVQSIPHFRPQTDFICDRQGVVLVDFVGRFEQLADDFAIVAARIGRECELPRKNLGPSDAETRLLSGEARSAAVDFYSRDFEILGYRAPD